MLLKKSKYLIVHFNHVLNIYLTHHSLHLKNMVIKYIIIYVIVTNMLLKQNIYHQLYLKYSTFKLIELMKHIIILF